MALLFFFLTHVLDNETTEEIFSGPENEPGPRPKILRKPTLSLEELRTWLYVAKFRHSIPHVAKGWTFESSTQTEPCVAHTDSIGKRMQRAM